MKSYDQPRQHIKKQRHYFANKGLSSQSYGFSTSHVWMWEFDYEESWALKNWCFWTMVLEKTLKSLLDCKEIQPVHPKGNQSWIFIGRTDAEAEALIHWSPYAKNWLLGKDPDAGKDWRQEEKGTTKAEMIGWHHWLNGHEFEEAPELVMDREAGVLQSMGSQRVRHDWATELTWPESWPQGASPSGTCLQQALLWAFPVDGLRDPQPPWDGDPGAVTCSWPWEGECPDPCPILLLPLSPRALAGTWPAQFPVRHRRPLWASSPDPISKGLPAGSCRLLPRGTVCGPWGGFWSPRLRLSWP